MEVYAAAFIALPKQGRVEARQDLSQQDHALRPAGGADIECFLGRRPGGLQLRAPGFRCAASTCRFLSAAFLLTPHQHGHRLPLDRYLDAPVHGCLGDIFLTFYFHSRKAAT